MFLRAYTVMYIYVCIYDVIFTVISVTDLNFQCPLHMTRIFCQQFNADCSLFLNLSPKAVLYFFLQFMFFFSFYFFHHIWFAFMIPLYFPLNPTFPFSIEKHPWTYVPVWQVSAWTLDWVLNVKMFKILTSDSYCQNLLFGKNLSLWGRQNLNGKFRNKPAIEY